MRPDELFELENQRILVVATDAGAALFLAPVIVKIQICNTVKVVAGVYGSITFSHHNIAHSVMNDETPQKSIADQLLSEGFDLALLGTNLGPGLEKLITINASEYGVKTMAVVDHYWHLWQRFADLETRVLNHYLPDDIWVFEEWQRDNLINKEVPSSNVHILPHPLLESFGKKNHFSLKNDFCNKYGINSNLLLIVYSSEPPPSEKSFWGTEEVTIDEINHVTKIIFDSVNKINKMNKKVHLIVKKHPIESDQFMSDYWEKLNDSCTILKDYNPLKLMLAGDVFLGISSMFLLESNSLGKSSYFLRSRKNFKMENIGMFKDIPLIKSRSDMINIINRRLKI